MKNLPLTICLVLQALAASSQTNCDCAFRNTVGLHYNREAGKHGAGLEYGKTGDESKFNIYIGADVFFPTQTTRTKHRSEGDTALIGRMYNKIGYRLIRIPYQLSVYANAFGGLDMETGVFSGVGLKLLRPFNENAISLEPMYIFGKRGRWSLQAAIHFKI